MMNGYILSILGIVIAGIIIDVIIPSGQINKYIKSIFSIFVVAVILSPIITFFHNNHGFNLKYEDYKVEEQLHNYINKQKVSSLEKSIKNKLDKEGFSNIDIKINYSIVDNDLSLNSCNVNLKKLVISKDKQHINKYEFIIEVVLTYTNLTEEVILFDE